MSHPTESACDYPMEFEFAYGVPPCRALIRAKPEHFVVQEILGFSLSGEGEHTFLKLQKTGLNTDYLVEQVSRLAGVRKMDIGYAGMKDRQAVTSQWFSVYLPGKEGPDWRRLEEIPGVKLLQLGRHTQKLRRGQHSGNRFCIRLSQLVDEPSDLIGRLNLISRGVPNYFGPQRFGQNGGNLVAADKMLKREIKPPGRHLKGIYLSSARSYLFNLVLSERVADGSWLVAETGDWLANTGVYRQREFPTGPLWGRGRIATESRIASIENKVAHRFPQWHHGLEHSGLQQQRRPLCLLPEALQWSINGDELELEFVLPPGGYATSVIRELCAYQDGGKQRANIPRGESS